VLDFGISKAPAHSPIKTSGMVLGSPIYFAPEQVGDPKAISPASDQYALGVILYECVTGRLPYEGSNLAEIFQAIVQGSYARPRTVRADLPAAFEEIIARAMSLAPGDRYPDLREMGRALLPYASPKTQLLWRDHFATGAGAAVGPPVGPSPVPVTDQTPGSSSTPLADTVSMPGRRPVDRAGPAPGWIPPTRLPWPTAHEALFVPRRFRALRWILGGGALFATAWLLGFMMNTRGRAPAPSPAPAYQPAAAAAPATTARAPARAATESGASATEERPTARAETAIEAKPAPAARAARRAPGQTAAHRPRFGPNQAPLIE
jgi:serine/threonine-protein kinase